jgi:hypothetical protein
VRQDHQKKAASPGGNTSSNHKTTGCAKVMAAS